MSSSTILNMKNVFQILSIFCLVVKQMQSYSDNTFELFKTMLKQRFFVIKKTSEIIRKLQVQTVFISIVE